MNVENNTQIKKFKINRKDLKYIKKKTYKKFKKYFKNNKIKLGNKRNF